jgi:RNA polymerase sigma-70 factor (ECF subfamily)
MFVRSLGADVRIGQADWMDSADRIDAAELHRRYLKEVFQYVSRRVPRQEAEDITMQVFAAALQALPRFRGDCPHRLWLLRIAHGRVADALRRRAARRETLASELVHAEAGADPLAEAMASALEGPEAVFERAEAQRVVRRLVDRLNPDQREALLLQYVEELPIAEIAVVMGRSPAAVNSLLQRARATVFRLGRAYFLDEGEGGSDD